MTTVSTPRKIATTATAAAALAKGAHTPVDATAGALTMTLPTTAAAGVEISVEKVDASTNAVTISGTLRGSASTITLTSQFEARTFLSEGSGSWRPTSDHRTATALAATIAAVSVNNSDPMRYDSTRLRAWRAALAKRSNTPVDILAIGDSWTSGKGATALPATRFLNLLRDQLRAKYNPAGVVGGENYWPSYNTSGGWTSPIVYTNGSPVQQTTFGLGRHVMRVFAGGTVAITFVGTGCDIVYAKGATGGQFSYNVDGGATVGPRDSNSATTLGGNVEPIRGLTAGSHTVTISSIVNDRLYLEGFTVYNGDETKGVRMWDSSFTGYRTTDFVDGTGVAYQSYSMVNPDLLLLELGINDLGGGTVGTPVNPATMATNLQALIAAVRAKCTVAPSVVLWVPPNTTPTAAAVDTWANYMAAITNLAKSDGQITLFDANSLLGDFSAADTYGIQNGDHLHPNQAGHQTIADGLFQLLTTAV